MNSQSEIFVVRSGSGYICGLPVNGDLPLMSSDKRDAVKFTLADAQDWVWDLHDCGMGGIVEFE